MRPPRSLAALAVLAAVSLSGLTACGGDSDDGSDGTGGTSAPASDAADPADPADPADDNGEGDGGGTPSATGFADCSAISAEEMAAVLGDGAGTAEEPPGGGGCTYALDDPTQPSVFVEQFATSDFADGFEGARANISSTAVGPMENSTETDLADVGDGAVVAVGDKVLGGDALQSIGLVLVGDTIVRATVLQAVDLDQAAMLAVTTDILTLVASKG